MRITVSILLAFMLIISGCVSTSKVDYPSYRLNDDAYENISQDKSVYIAPIELFSIRYSNFEDVYGVVQSEIESYMQKNGFDVLSSDKCESAFIHNISKTGGFFSQQTGKIDAKLLQKCINETITELKKGSDYSAMVIPFFAFSPLSLKRPYTNGTWDGVKRKVKNNSISGVSFSAVQTMSIKLIVISNSGDSVFESIGGIDFIQKVKEAGSSDDLGIGLVVKEAKEFSIEDIREGIEIAFHPFIFCQRIGDAKEKL